MIGCYSDRVDDRDLQSEPIDYVWMTLDYCAAHCLAKVRLMGDLVKMGQRGVTTMRQLGVATVRQLGVVG